MSDSKSQTSDQYKGWLYKWTNYIKGYQKRWFVLQNGLLSYYRSVFLILKSVLKLKPGNMNLMTHIDTINCHKSKAILNTLNSVHGFSDISLNAQFTSQVCHLPHPYYKTSLSWATYPSSSIHALSSAQVLAEIPGKPTAFYHFVMDVAGHAIISRPVRR